MIRRSTLWAVAAACVVGGVATLFLRTTPDVPSVTSPPSATAKPAVPRASPQDSETSSRPDPVAERSADEAPEDPRSTGDQAISANPTPAITELELLDARTAVGRAFPLSPSLSRRCDRRQVTTAACDIIRDFLDRMKMERRDILWAREMEERLEKSIENLDGGAFEIRAIECRSKRCAVEVAAIDNHYGGDIESDSVLDEELIRSTTMFVRESASGGQRLIVTVATFKRASSFEIRDGKLVEK